MKIIMQSYFCEETEENRFVLDEHSTCIEYMNISFPFSFSRLRLEKRLGHNEIRRPWWLMQILCSAFLLYLKLIRLCFYLGGCWTKYLSGYKYTIFKFDNTPVFQYSLRHVR